MKQNLKTNKTVIIAEAGVNHNGDIALAQELIDVAADAGADLVKFQTFSADRLVTKNARKAGYQLEATTNAETQGEMLSKLELTPKTHERLIDYCSQKGIGFLSTAFDILSADLLRELGINVFKIPSGEITNLPFLNHIGGYGETVILSTGMATLGEIEVALGALNRGGTPLEHITLLHCNTAYPTPFEDVNLSAMRTIARAFSVSVGYSDHSPGIEIPIAAVALGASVVEKHFTVDSKLPGPDHRISLEPGELKAMVLAIRNVEMALGDGIKRPSLSEMENIKLVRKSLVAAVPISKGELLSEKNLAIKRPGMGISPARWSEVLGRPALRDFQTDELIEI